MERVTSFPAAAGGRRAVRIVAAWLLVAAALHIGWWSAMTLLAPGFSVQRLIGVIVNAAPFYGPLFVVAVAPPAALHLFAGRLARTWSWLSLAGSILVPAALVLLIRASYARDIARGGHIEGKGLWDAFSFVAMLGMYFAACALTFAIAAPGAADPRGGRSKKPLIALAATALLLHAAIALGQFAPFFAFVYG